MKQSGSACLITVRELIQGRIQKLLVEGEGTGSIDRRGKLKTAYLMVCFDCNFAHKHLILNNRKISRTGTEISAGKVTFSLVIFYFTCRYTGIPRLMTLNDLQRRTIFAVTKAFSSKENHCQNLDRRPAKFLTRLDQLMMTPKVEFLKYSINILHVVKFIFQNV